MLPAAAALGRWALRRRRLWSVMLRTRVALTVRDRLPRKLGPAYMRMLRSIHHAPRDEKQVLVESVHAYLASAAHFSVGLPQLSAELPTWDEVDLPGRRLRRDQSKHRPDAALCNVDPRSVLQPRCPAMALVQQSFDEADPHQRGSVQFDEVGTRQPFCQTVHRSWSKQLTRQRRPHIVSFGLDLIDHRRLDPFVTTFTRKPPTLRRRPDPCASGWR